MTPQRGILEAEPRPATAVGDDSVGLERMTDRPADLPSDQLARLLGGAAFAVVAFVYPRPAELRTADRNPQGVGAPQDSATR